MNSMFMVIMFFAFILLMMLINMIFTQILIKGKKTKEKVIALLVLVLLNVLVFNYMQGDFGEIFYFIPLVLFPTYHPILRRK